jgi:hypothetical protein
MLRSVSRSHFAPAMRFNPRMEVTKHSQSRSPRRLSLVVDCAPANRRAVPSCYWYTETGPSPTTANANLNTTFSFHMICFASFAFFFRGMMRWSKCCNALWTWTDSEYVKRAMYEILRQCRSNKTGHAKSYQYSLSVAFVRPDCS